MIRLSMRSVALGLVSLAIFCGCRSMTSPVTYYTLNPMAQPAEETAMEGDPDVVIGVRPVVLPGTIDRTQMVTRSNANQLTISALNRWADYPNQLVQQILGENLQRLMPDARVVSAPWPMGLKPDLTVTVKFNELIGTTDKRMLLSAVWTITPADPDRQGKIHRLNLTEPMAGNGYDELAAAHSRAIESLSRRIVDSLKAFRG